MSHYLLNSEEVIILTNINSFYIKRKLSEADPYLKRLKDLNELTLDEIISNFDLTHSIERYIEILAQIIIDICFHITSRSQVKVPENYGECIQSLISLNILDEIVGENIRRFIKLRNLIVHRYGTINFKQVMTYFPQILHDFQKYKSSILKFLK